MIAIRELSKRFGSHQAVNAVSLEIETGQIFGIMGPNGAGKTTLFRLLCQIIRPDSGTITVNGAEDELGIKRQIGYLPEEHRMYEHMRTLDYLVYFCDLLGVPRRRGQEVLSKVGLDEKAFARISSLSKGMRQKVAFARTLVTDPPVLILDEPTYGLDPRTSQQMREWIRAEALNKTVVLSSHNLHEAERSCDRVAIIHRGRLAACGSPRSLIQDMKKEHILEVGFHGPDAPLRRAVANLPTSRPPIFETTIARLYFPKTSDPYEILQAILKAVQDEPEDISISGIVPREATLEDVFLKVTGEIYEEADKLGEPATDGEDS